MKEGGKLSKICLKVWEFEGPATRDSERLKKNRQWNISIAATGQTAKPKTNEQKYALDVSQNGKL